MYESFERKLGQREVHDLLAVAVEHGLLDISQRELLAAIRKPSIADAASVAVEIRVATYTLNGQEQGAVSRSFHLLEPWALRRYNPENRVIAGLVEISSRLASYKDAPETNRPHRQRSSRRKHGQASTAAGGGNLPLLG